MKILKTLLRSINFDNETYKVSPWTQNSLGKGHSASINRIGMLHPPIIKESSAKKYVIVCGRKRLLHARDQRHLSKCSCLVVPEKYDHLKTWGLILEDMLLDRPLTAIEMAEFFKNVLLLAEIETIATQFLPMLNLTPNTFQIKKLLPLTKLAEPLKIAIQGGTLDQKAATQLANLSFRDSLALFELIEHLHLSVGNQRKFINSILDMEKRKNSSVLTLLTTPKLQKIIDSGQNIPQKAASVMKYLAQELTPELARTENDFKDFANTLKLPDAITLNHSQSFEKDSMTLSITFKEKKQLLRFWQAHGESIFLEP